MFYVPVNFCMIITVHQAGWCMVHSDFITCPSASRVVAKFAGCIVQGNLGEYGPLKHKIADIKYITVLIETMLLLFNRQTNDIN